MIAAVLAVTLCTGSPFIRYFRGPETVLLADVMPVKPAPKPPEKKPEVKIVEPPAAAVSPALALAEKVQKFYEKTADFSADFQQTYRYVAMGRTQKSAGTVQVKKPGLMRWDYAKPAPKSFILDGKALYLWDPEDKTVVVNKAFATDSLSAAVTFLWGKGKLADEFELETSKREDYGTTVLSLTPKKAQGGFSRLFFAIDEATGQVQTSIVIDTQGNENRISFTNVKTNAGLEAKRFAFEIPKGATVQEWK